MSARWTLALLFTLAGLLTPAPAAQVLISEFMASDFRSLTDEDLEHPDWIELHNPGTSPINLDGWYLTDEPDDLRKWRFPSTPLPANSLVTVFASGKNRRVPGQALHTSFKLDTDGEFLALVQPDGRTLASVLTPTYPPQATGISYGIPTRRTRTHLLTSRNPLRYLVPTQGQLDEAWAQLDHADETWSRGTNGVGYVVGVAPTATATVADSAADFSGLQGAGGWSYGYYRKTGDANTRYDATDFVPFPSGPGPTGPDQFWNGGSWAWQGASPLDLELGEYHTQPNGANHGPELWPIRRWTNPLPSTLTFEWTVTKEAPYGNGVTARLFQNGTERQSIFLAANNLTPTARTFVTLAQPGDVFDFALTPSGSASALDDTGDATLLYVQIKALRSLADPITTDLGPSLASVTSTACLRFPFELADPSAIDFLTLRLQYSDGFVAYLNGVPVAQANAAESPTWNALALASRTAEQTLAFEEFDLSGFRDLLQPGRNVLALQALKSSPADPTFLLHADLRAESLELDPTSYRYFSVPTPGVLNGPGNAQFGPLIVEVTHAPNPPTDHSDLFVTARILPTREPVGAVQLTYRVGYGAEITQPMHDSGAAGDRVAGDGIWSAAIPAEAYRPGHMVRYFVTALDAQGGPTRSPPYPDPKNSPQYHGTVVLDTNVVSALPVLHWYLSNTASADTTSGARGSLFFAGEFYDNVRVYLHGQSSMGFPKKSYNVDLNSGEHFRFDPAQRRVKKFNLLTTYPDKAHLRNLLAYETFRDAGAAHHVAFPVRIQRNSAFFADAHFVEDGDEDFLSRLGLDPRGALYKAYNSLETATSGLEKKTRKQENNADVQALINGLRLTGTARTTFLFDHVNLPATLNYLTALIITGNVDCCHKNYYLYRDTEGTGEWQMMPWDVDLSFGRNWTGEKTYYDDTMYWQNGLWIGGNNTLPGALFGTTPIRAMYLRRLRTLMDELLQPAETPPELLRLERRIYELSALIAPDAALDFAKWPTWGQRQTLPQAVTILTNDYLPRRRNYLFKTLTAGANAIPAAQSEQAFINLVTVDSNPTSGNQDEEYVRLENPGTLAVDVSGWRVAGAIEHTFHPGTVLPAKTSLYLSPNVTAFRARRTAPRGGQGLFVQGNYRGQLSAWGETLTLLNRRGVAVSSLSYPGNPSPAQRQLRITQIMFHPPPSPANDLPDPEDAEYLELTNLGPDTLDLSGIRLTEGVRFDFTTSPLTHLAPGQRCYLVSRPEAARLRYGPLAPIAGTFDGHLDNRGESLRLEDAVGEKVLEFAYNNSWYPATDGQGAALGILDPNLPWSAWGRKESWGPVDPAGHGFDAWRQHYFTAAELADPTLSGPDADADGDQASNEAEFIAGTHPRESDSRLALTVEPGPHGIRLSFITTPRRIYTLQSNPSLSADAWTTVETLIAPPAGGIIERFAPLNPEPRIRYFRVTVRWSD